MKTIEALKQYSNGISMYQTINGTYPAFNSICLGSTNCSQVTAGTACFGYGVASNNATFDVNMTTILGSLPRLSTQRMNCNGVMYSGGFYHSNDGNAANVFYYLKGDQNYPATIGILTNVAGGQQDDVTLCVAALPVL